MGISVFRITHHQIDIWPRWGAPLGKGFLSQVAIEKCFRSPVIYLGGNKVFITASMALIHDIYAVYISITTDDRIMFSILKHFAVAYDFQCNQNIP